MQLGYFRASLSGKIVESNTRLKEQGAQFWPVQAPTPTFTLYFTQLLDKFPDDTLEIKSFSDLTFVLKALHVSEDWFLNPWLQCF